MDFLIQYNQKETHYLCSVRPEFSSPEVRDFTELNTLLGDIHS
jgi:hypothetical protein